MIAGLATLRPAIFVAEHALGDEIRLGEQRKRGICEADVVDGPLEDDVVVNVYRR